MADAEEDWGAAIGEYGNEAKEKLPGDAEPMSKKKKLEEKNGTDSSVAQSALPAMEEKEEAMNGKEKKFKLDGFEIVKVLLNDPESMRAHVHGKFPGCSDDVVLTLSKTPFSTSNIESILSKETSVHSGMENDIYSQHQFMPAPELNALKVVVIQPATAKHIEKYSDQNVYLVRETAEDYKNITIPHLEKQQFSNQWVYNILEHRSESERIVYECSHPVDGFVLLPDLKWDCKQVSDLYLVAIVNRRDVGSIRDLNRTHLPLLKGILKNGCETIEREYGVLASQLRVYLHYPPSYYHLHVHFNHVRGPKAGATAGKAHLLEDVIENIENVDGEYYGKRTLTVALRQRDPLLQQFVEKGRTKISS